MRNESKFYQDKENKEISKFHELCKKLPIYARRYLQNREMAVKYSTLVAYTYDLQTFFEFLKETIRNLTPWRRVKYRLRPSPCWMRTILWNFSGI